MKYAACFRCPPRIDTARKQHGATLVLALLVLALVAGMATWLAEEFQRTIRRAGNRLHVAQGLHYLQSAEALARYGLAQDQRAGDTDHFAESWAQPQPPFDVPGGWVAVSMQDAQGRLNINNLLPKADDHNAAEGDANHFTPAQRRFIRLLQTYKDAPLSEQEAIAITEAVIDWLDSDDSETGFGGAEALYYQNYGYLPANRAMQSITELRLVRGVGPELYAQVQRDICALPAGSTLNLNTASVNILRTLTTINHLQPLAEEDALQLEQIRGQTGFADLAAFYDTAVMLAQKKKGQLSADGLGVSSQFFLLSAESVISGRRSVASSLLRRSPETVRVIKRRLGKQVL